MATLEDKILGEKREYYCSSSSEDENDSTESDKQQKSPKSNVGENLEYKSVEVNEWEGVSSNTGPKGVIRV